MDNTIITIGLALQEGSLVIPSHNNDLIAAWSYGIGDSPHGLLVGATGSGKTTLVRWIVIDLMWAPGPKKITLIDGKGANSFLMFKGQPYVGKAVFNKPGKFSGAKDPIPEVIRAFHKEVQDRYDTFDAAKKKAHKTFSRIEYDPPEPMWLIFDEYMDWILGLPKRVQTEMLKLLIHIAQTAREVNCHLLIATQAPYAETIYETGMPGLLKRQLKCRIAVVGNHGLDEVEAKMAFGAGNGDAGERINKVANKVGLKGRQRRGVGLLRIGFQEAYFKAPWVADPFHWETNEKDRVAALRMLPNKLKLINSTQDSSEETA